MSLLRIACTLVLLFAAPTLARGQMKDALANSTPMERANFQTDFMKEKIPLTADEVPKVRAINLDAAGKMEPVIKSSEGPVKKLHDAREIETQKEAKLKGVLNPEQFEKYLALREEMKQKLEEKLAKKAAEKTP